MGGRRGGERAEMYSHESWSRSMGSVSLCYSTLASKDGGNNIADEEGFAAHGGQSPSTLGARKKKKDNLDGIIAPPSSPTADELATQFMQEGDHSAARPEDKPTEGAPSSIAHPSLPADLSPKSQAQQAEDRRRRIMEKKKIANKVNLDSWTQMKMAGNIAFKAGDMEMAIVWYEFLYPRLVLSASQDDGHRLLRVVEVPWR